MPNPGQPADAWASGDAYEPYIGRWSRRVAAVFLDWLDVPKQRRWLEVGCGTGALTATLLDRTEPLSVVGMDASENYVAYARNRVGDPRAQFLVGDARHLPLGRNTADAAVSGLVLNFVPDPASMVHEMDRVTGEGGTVAAYVWDYAGEMALIQSFWAAAAALDPSAANLDEGRRFPICQPQPLYDLFAGCALANVEVRAIDIATVFRSFDDYWAPFLGGQGPAPSYVMALGEEQRIALRERLREMLPREADGSIHLQARAWAVRGTVGGEPGTSIMS